MSRKSIKILLLFYAIVILVFVIVFLSISGHSILKVEKRKYNMNMSESINLDSVYSSLDKDVIWESSDDNVVVEDHVVTAISEGDAYVVGRVGNKQVSDVTIHVLDKDSSLAIKDHSIETTMDESPKIEVIVNNSRGDDTPSSSQVKEDDSYYHEDDTIFYDDVEVEDESITIEDSSIEDSSSSEEEYPLTYESSDEEIATVDTDGNVLTVSPGTVIITVKDDIGHEDYTYVTVMEDELVLANDSYVLKEGSSVDVKYTLNSNRYTDDDIIWESNHEDIVSVNKGKITAIQDGEATISVCVGDSIREIKVVVEKNVILPYQIDVSTDKVTLMVGDEIDIIANVLPIDTTDKSITWKSDNSNIATVNNGKIIGKGIGKTVVTATTSNGIYKNVEVMVTKRVVSVTDIHFQDKELSMVVGDHKKLEYYIGPLEATDKSVKIDYDQNYINIDDDGNITAKRAGKVIVTITSIDSNISDTMTVNIINPVVKVNSITLNKSNISLRVGDTSNIVATISPSNVTNKNVIWSSNNTKVATVDNNGKVKATGVGNAIITVTSKENSTVKSSCMVTVVTPVVKVSRVTLNKNNIPYGDEYPVHRDGNGNIIKTNEYYVNYGNTYQLSATVSPSNATNKEVTYVSSDSSWVSVDNNGKLTILLNKTGKVRITVKSKNDSSIKDSIIIKVRGKLKKLGTVDLTGHPEIALSSNDGITSAQGFCVAGNYYIAARRNGNESKASIFIYHKNTGKKLRYYVKDTILGHANGLTYNANNGNVYVIGVGATYYFSLKDAVNGNFSLHKLNFYHKNGNIYNFGGIAYDSSNSKYYTQSGAYISVTNNDRVVEKTYIKVRLNTNQDIGTYKGMILSVNFNGQYGDSDNVNKTRNSIDIYRASNGEYLGSYIVKINRSAELEGIDYFGNGNTFAFYVQGYPNDYIYKGNMIIPD